MRVWHMRRGISFTVSAGDGQRLRAIVADPKSPQKRVCHAVRGAQHSGWNGHRAEHAAPPPSGVRPLPQPHRARGAGGQGHPRDPRQLRGAQEGQGQRLASLPNSRGAGSSTVSSIPSSISRAPSIASSVNTMPPTHNHSSGKHIPMTSSPHETEGSKRWNQSTRPRRDGARRKCARRRPDRAATSFQPKRSRPR